MYKLISKNHNLILTVAKTGISLAAVYFLWNHRSQWQSLQSGFSVISWKLISILLVLSFFNWFFEIIKWQYLTKPVKIINFTEAGKQSLISFSVSLLTPNRIGDYGAKVLFYDKSDHKKIISLNFIAQTSQLILTIIMGLLGLSSLYFFSQNLKIDSIWLKIGLFLIVFGIILLFLIKIYKKRQSAEKLLWSPHLWQIGILFSAIRYLIFSSQFVLLLLFFKINLDLTTLYTAVFMTYFIAAMIPMLAFMDWAVKASVAVGVFSLFHIPQIIIFKIIGLMWLSNFMLAFLVGLILMWFSKWHK